MSRPPAIRVSAALMSVYLYFFFVLLPLLSPLRNLGVLEPGLIRNFILPPLFVAIVLFAGIGRIIRPRSEIQVIIAIMVVTAAIIGSKNLINDEAYRNYMSHIFQGISAYVMIGLGWILAEYNSRRYWKILVGCAFVSSLISALVTINALESGDIGRYYTAAYGFILIGAYGAAAAGTYLLLSIFGSFISNKRAVLLSLLTIFALSIIKRVRYITWSNFIRAGALSVTGLVVLISGGVIAHNWASENPEAGLARAINISQERLMEVARAKYNRDIIDRVSAGRLEEVEAAIDTIGPKEILLGSGAGWTITLGNAKEVQNIHFTPLSLLAVYGMPLAILFYVSLVRLYFAAVKRNNYASSIAMKMAPFYFIGALVHSMFAYSLFIDWTFFFFCGVLSKMASKRNSAGSYDAL